MNTVFQQKCRLTWVWSISNSSLCVYPSNKQKKLFTELKFPNFFPNFFAKILWVQKFHFFQKISKFWQLNISETRKNEKFGKFHLTQGLKKFLKISWSNAYHYYVFLNHFTIYIKDIINLNRTQIIWVMIKVGTCLLKSLLSFSLASSICNVYHRVPIVSQ